LNEEAIRAIEAADAQRREATIGKDAATLDMLFGDDLLFVHAGAVAEDKAKYIARICRSSHHYRGLTYLRREFRVFGAVVLVDGDLRLQVATPGGERDVVVRFLQVWVRRDGRWQLVSWQSTPIRARPIRRQAPGPSPR